MIYDEPEAIQNILRHMRLMRRFFNDVVDEDPKTRVFLPELHCAFMDMLNEEFAPNALSLALGCSHGWNAPLLCRRHSGSSARSESEQIESCRSPPDR